MNDTLPGLPSVRCEHCGSPVMLRDDDPLPDSNVVCGDCGTVIGTYAEFVALAEAEAMKAIRRGLGSN